MGGLTIVRFTADVTLNFVVKNSICYYGLDNIRRELQLLFTTVTEPHLGSFAAPLVGSQLGIAFAIPVTLFYADLACFALKEAVRAVSDLFLSLFADYTPARSSPLSKCLLFRIVSYVTAFFAKTYFCNYAMPVVGTALQQAARLIVPLCGLSMPLQIMVPGIILLATPSITFIAADIVSFFTERTVYSLLEAMKK